MEKIENSTEITEDIEDSVTTVLFFNSLGKCNIFVIIEIDTFSFMSRKLSRRNKYEQAHKEA